VGRPIFENPNPAQHQPARSRELKTEASPRIRPLRDGGKAKDLVSMASPPGLHQWFSIQHRRQRADRPRP